MRYLVSDVTSEYLGRLIDLMSRFIQRLKTLPLESIVWSVGLILLAFYDPTSSTHVSICPISNLGFDFCPGCGLGRSVSFLFRGEFVKSFEAHPLGMFAAVVLILRVFKLIRISTPNSLRN